MKKAIFAPESSREFQKRLNDLINAAEKLNKIEMKTPLERIELAEKELKAAKEALGKSEIPEYVEIIKQDRLSNIGDILKVVDYDGGGLPYCTITKCGETRWFYKNEVKPSTKEAFDKQNEIIRVPDCIKFEIFVGCHLGIAFNDCKQHLMYFDEVYSVGACNSDDVLDGSNFKLTKCDRNDLKAGDVAFRQLWTHGLYLSNIDYYCVVLNNDSVVGVHDDTDIEVIDYNEFHWYKVEKI